MKIIRRCSGFLILTAWGASFGLWAEGSEATPAEELERYWSSGAEITRFELSQARYGEVHSGHAEFIFAREPFLVEAQVKRDFGEQPAVAALKLNALRTFNTGLYSYRTMQSTFAPFDRDTFPYALKSALSVQDWCGQVFLQINRKDDAWNLSGFSYFQAEGDKTLSLAGVWLEDDIWLLLRQAPSKLPIGKFEAIPSLLFGRFAHKESKAVLAVGSISKQGKKSRYRIEYPDLERSLEISFNAEFPYYIQGWVETDETGTTTAKRTHGMGQVEYWNLNSVDDAELRNRLGLEEVPN